MLGGFWKIQDMRDKVMSSYKTNEFRAGLKVMIDGSPCAIVENEFVKPGKGQAFSRVKYRNFKTNRVNEKTFRSGESVEAADVAELELQFLYSDGDAWHFMDPVSHEQLAATREVIGETVQWLKEGELCTVITWQDTVLMISPPNFVVLRIAQTDPGVRGDTATGGTKPATLETGAVVKVPLFLDEGESIRIDTRSGAYMSRAKE